MDADLLAKIQANPKYQTLKARRTRFGWILTVVMLIAYFGYIGLIAFDTDANIERRLKGEKPRFRFLRPRTAFYGAVLLLVSAIMLVTFTTRHTLDLDVLRDRNPNFVTLADGAVRNAYTLKLMNRSGQARTLTLSVGGLAARSVNVIGVGMTKFAKPGSSPDYHDMAREAGTIALKDAGIPYDQVEQAFVGYVYGDSTCGQRAVYELGLSGIPVVNVNNNCSTGSSALFLARQAIEGGLAECVIALPTTTARTRRLPLRAPPLIPLHSCTRRAALRK